MSPKKLRHAIPNVTPTKPIIKWTKQGDGLAPTLFNIMIKLTELLAYVSGPA